MTKTAPRPWEGMGIEIDDELTMQWETGGVRDPEAVVVYTWTDGTPFVRNKYDKDGEVFPLIEGDLVVEHRKARRRG